MQSGTASNEATWLHGIQSLISCAYRLGSIFQFVWQAAKPITAQPFFHVCNWANLRLRWKWKDNYTDLFLWTSYTGSSWLVNPICFPPLIRKNWILDLLHDRCIPHHNSVRQVWASVLLTSVRPDAVSFSWNTCLGRMFDPPTWSLNLHSSSCNSFKKSETASHFFTFHPVVCRWLNNWPGFAFFRFSPCRLWLVEQLTAIPGFISFCQPRKPPFSTLSERLTSFWHCNMTSFMLQDMPFRCGHFLLVDLVKSSCAGIGGLTTSAVYGVDLNFRPLILIRGFCIGLLIHQFVIETDSPCLISTVIHLPHLCAGHHFSLVAILLLATTVPDKYPLPSCTFSARNLRVTVIFGRGFKWFSCTQHQSSLHAYLLSTAIASCISMSSNFLAIACGSNFSTHKGLLGTSCSFAAILLLAAAAPHECPLPICSFSARHSRVTVNFGRGLQVVFLHSDTSLISVPSSSVFHASSAACHLAITSIIFYTLQLSSHCLRIQPLHSQGIRTTTACGLPKKPMLRHGVCVRVCVELEQKTKTCRLLLFQLSDFCRGTWHAIRDRVQRSYLIAWDTEPDQLCLPARLHFPICMASGQAHNRPAVFSCLHNWCNLRPIYFFGHLTLDPRDCSIPHHNSIGQVWASVCCCDYFLMCQEPNSQPPALSFSGWANALQAAIRAKGLYTTAPEVIEAAVMHPLRGRGLVLGSIIIVMGIWCLQLGSFDLGLVAENGGLARE